MAIRQFWYAMIFMMLAQHPIVAVASGASQNALLTKKQLALLAIAGGVTATGVAWKNHYLAPILLNILSYAPEAVLRRTPLWLVYPSLKKTPRGNKAAFASPKSPFKPEEKIPIVYRDEYNFSQGGVLNSMLSYLHPFDTQKYRTIADTIIKWLGVDKSQFFEPLPVSDEDLSKVHTPDYLNSLRSSSTISEIIDMGQLLSWVPNSFFQNNLLVPMKYAVGGTIEAARLALKYGWAINLAGGYHHAKAGKGEGGCVYADIPLALQKLWEVVSDLKVMIIDLDAHQSNGIESMLGNNSKVYIFDMFNQNVAPVELELLEEKPMYTYDIVQKKLMELESIRPLGKLPNVYAVPLSGGELSSKVYGISMPDIFYERCVNRAISAQEYMSKLHEELPKAYEDCLRYFGGRRPDLVIYNAGTDIYEDDKWGCMNVDKFGIYDRDRYVFEYVMRDKKIPILMLPAGGYFKESGRVIGTSIVNIVRNVVVPVLQQKKR